MRSLTRSSGHHDVPRVHGLEAEAIWAAKVWVFSNSMGLGRPRRVAATAVVEAFDVFEDSVG